MELVKKLLSKIYQGSVELLFPKICPICDRRLSAGLVYDFCSSCFCEIRFVQAPFCIKCGRQLIAELPTGVVCGQCCRFEPSYSFARSILIYTKGVRKLVHGLKYGYDTSIKNALIALTCEFDRKQYLTCDVVIPVPLSGRRFRQRGFNQSMFLAKILFAKTTIPVKPSILLKIKETLPQTTLPKRKRLTNLTGVFRVRDASKVRGKIICLVDDVFTTGTTLQECSKELMANGAIEVRVLTLAQVDDLFVV